jgi:hypothetical protein
MHAEIFMAGCLKNYPNTIANANKHNYMISILITSILKII